MGTRPSKHTRTLKVGKGRNWLKKVWVNISIPKRRKQYGDRIAASQVMRTTGSTASTPRSIREAQKIITAQKLLQQREMSQQELAIKQLQRARSQGKISHPKWEKAMKAAQGLSTTRPAAPQMYSDPDRYAKIIADSAERTRKMKETRERRQVEKELQQEFIARSNLEAQKNKSKRLSKEDKEFLKGLQRYGDVKPY